jgi:hypothetical protein
MGAPSATGGTGPTGSTGPTGDIGPTGPIGLLGPAGPIGPTGATGVTGAPGVAGLTGTIGPTGEAGSVQPFSVQGTATTIANPPIGQVFDVSVNCPPGSTVLSGGFNVSGDMTSGAPRVLTSMATSTTTWNAIAVTISAHDNISVYATVTCSPS